LVVGGYLALRFFFVIEGRSKRLGQNFDFIESICF
jgi:hypothetical protein